MCLHEESDVTNLRVEGGQRKFSDVDADRVYESDSVYDDEVAQ